MGKKNAIRKRKCVLFGRRSMIFRRSGSVHECPSRAHRRLCAAVLCATRLVACAVYFIPLGSLRYLQVLEGHRTDQRRQEQQVHRDEQCRLPGHRLVPSFFAKALAAGAPSKTPLLSQGRFAWRLAACERSARRMKTCCGRFGSFYSHAQARFFAAKSQFTRFQKCSTYFGRALR